MDIKIGSLYTVVRNLEKSGFIEVADTTRSGARPERTVYRITGAGRAELVDWARELVTEPQPEHPRFKAGLSVLSTLSPQEVPGLLRARLAALEEGSAARRRALGEYAAQVPRLFLLEAEFELAMRDAEAAWVSSLVEELESGAFPDMAVWQAVLAHLEAQIDAPSELGGTE